MAVIGGSSPVITSGLVYGLDFKNSRSYTTENTTAKSLVYNPIDTILTGVYGYDEDGLIVLRNNQYYLSRSSSLSVFDPDESFTVCAVLRIDQSGPLLLQNTTGVNFAIQANTSSLSFGFYNPTAGSYYIREYNVDLKNSNLSYIACRYSSGSIDFFINGTPLTSSQSPSIIPSIATGSYSTKITFSDIGGATYIGATPGYVNSFSGSLAQLFIYNRALSSDEIYNNYVPHITSQFGLQASSLNKPYTLDENALMYISASNITSSTEIAAVTSFVNNLKSTKLWDKVGVSYPFLGATTSSRAINLKDPGVNRLIYSGSWITSSNGIYPTSITSYLQVPGLEYPAISTSSAHITYTSYDTASSDTSLIAIDNLAAAEGGEIFNLGSRIYHVFKTTGTSSFKVLNPSLTEVDVLVVAGGGSGGSQNAGGGGAGGLIYSGSYTVSATVYNVIIGDGGREVGYQSGLGRSGQNSAFNDIVAIGGGYGGGYTIAGGNGGSGGGGGGFAQSGSGTPSQGNDGGRSTFSFTGAGGGGSGQKGQDPTINEIGGNGGSGSYYPQYANLNLGSPAGWFAGGGGGGGSNGGGFGGPGGGGNQNRAGLRFDSIVNTGGGGGAARSGGTISGQGGSGLVVISYSASLATFTSSFGLRVSGSSIIGNLQSTNTFSTPMPYNIGTVTVSRTNANSIVIAKDITGSTHTAPVTASVINTLYGNASNYLNTPNKFSSTGISYLSHGSGMMAAEVSTYHTLVGRLQFDLGRGGLIEGFPAAAAYSVRQLSKMSQYSMEVRRDFDNVTFDVGFDELGNLNTSSLLTNMTASGLTPTLPGDYSGLAAAYSLRRVSSSYDGFAIEIQTGSDTLNVGFDSFGNLDTSSLLSFIGSGNAYIRTWYDQSGNNNHATQFVTSSQPLIVSNGVIVTENGKPAIEFNLGNYFDTPIKQTWNYLYNFNVYKPSLSNPANGKILSDYNAFTDFIEIGTQNEQSHIIARSTTSAGLVTASGYTVANTQVLQHAFLSSPNVGTSINGFALITGSDATLGSVTNQTEIRIGGRPANTSTYRYVGTIQEIILNSSNISSSRGLIEDNINGYYNIFTHSLDSGSGYVTTWYDQSGNNKHAIQTTNAFQPLILSSGSLITLFNKPTIRFNNPAGLDIPSSGYDFATNNTLFFVHQNTGGGALMGSFYRYYRFESATSAVMGSGGTNIVVSENFRTGSLITSIQETGRIITAFKNGRDITVTKGVRSTGGTWEKLGYSGGGSTRADFYIGTISEFILNKTVLSSSTRQPIEQNINSYFNIY